MSELSNEKNNEEVIDNSVSDTIKNSSTDGTEIDKAKSGAYAAEPKRNKKKIAIIGSSTLLLLAAAAGITTWQVHEHNEKTYTHVPQAISFAKKGTLSTADLCNSFTNANLQCNVAYQTKNGTKNGDLVSQSLASGEKVKKNSPVVLTYSLGPESIVLPEVRNNTVNDMQAELAEENITFKVVSQSNDSLVAANRIVSIVPKSGFQVGSSVENGSVIPVVVSSGKTTVPNWVGKTKNVVLADAKTKGLNVKFNDMESDGPSGIVLAQSETGLQDSNSTILVTLSKPVSVKTLKVPNVVGMDTMTAQVQIASAGFQNIVVLDNTNPAVKKDVVTKTDPVANSSAKSTDTITISVDVPKQ